MTTNHDYIRELAPEAPSWVHEQIAEELDRRDAEIERLRALLVEARNDIRCDIENRYPPEMRRYPSEMRRYQSEMDFVHRIEAALAGKEDAQ